MKAKWSITLLIAVCLGTSSFAAQAQTARIAHLSHSGSLATLAEAETTDNFGIPPSRFITDTIVATSDTTAVAHGRVSRWGNREGDGTRSSRVINYGKYPYQQSTATGPQSRGTAVRLLQQRYPEAKLVGFDTLAKSVAPATPPKKQKAKRKRQEGAVLLMPLSSVPPQHPGVWLALVVIVGLGAAGLLLHEKSLPTFTKTA